MSEFRAVAFLDILGFKDLIAKYSADKIAEKYSRLIDHVNLLNSDLHARFKEPSLFSSKLTDNRWCISKIFSDSIILIARDGSEESCLRLLVYVWRSLQTCLSLQMPFRGGIAYDEMFVDEGKEIFLGRALMKAYELEGSQEWIGAAIHEDLVEAYPNIFNDDTRPYLKSIFLKYPVPFKGGGIKHLHTINWRFNLIVEKGTRSLMPYSLDKGVITKIKNTLEYAENVVRSGVVYFSDDYIPPIELRAFWCGGSEPPFPHGDDL